MRTLNHPTRKSLSLPAVLYALSDPLRLTVVRKLATQGQHACGQFCLPVAKSTASHHFRVLREAGIIQMTPHGTQFITSLRREDLQKRFPGLLDAVLQASASQ